MTSHQRQQSFPSGCEPLFADGCGNTFLIYDCLHRPFHLCEWEQFKEEVWNALPQAGVDDALVLRRCSEDERTVFIKMHVLEPDGTEADFCGNGARTTGHYLHCRYHRIGKQFFLVSRHGFHRFSYEKGECFVEMGKPLLKGTCSFSSYDFDLVDCVEPHLVTGLFFDAATLERVGREINAKCRNLFPRGVNVNCMRCVNENTLEVLTFERGVYRITQACGTGSTACTYLAKCRKMLSLKGPVTVKVLGGQLKILKKDRSLWLGGPVKLG